MLICKPNYSTNKYIFGMFTHILSTKKCMQLPKETLADNVK